MRVSSVGTLELGSVPALPEAIDAGRGLSVDLRRHRARSLRDVDISSADLVLGFEPSHVSAAINVGRAVPNRTFLLRELIALVGGTVDENDAVLRARSVVAKASSRRVSSPWGTGLTIADPLGKPAKVMRATASEIDRLVQRLALGLFGVHAGDAP